MKAKELMIGDWVQIVEPCKYAGAIGRIKTLIDHKDEENAYFKVFLQNNTIHIGIEDICSEDIRPIPLTSEILEKNDFEKRWQDVYEYFNDDENLNITFYPKSSNYTNGAYDYIDIEKGCMTINEMPIAFVHELQHACGASKEIKL